MHLFAGCKERNVNQRSGHAAGHGNNTDKYFRPSVQSSAPGGMALAGFPNIHGLVTPAALPEAIIRKLDKYINTVFPFVTFTAFTDEKGNLAPVL